jgi:hypothetical protein
MLSPSRTRGRVSEVGSYFGSRSSRGVGVLSEQAGRWIDRRGVLRGALVGAVTGMGAIALGQRPAFATPSCSHGVDCGPTPSCNAQAFCGGGSGGCPTGYSLCHLSGPCGSGKQKNEQGYWCEWSSGYWVACNGCNGSGTYKLCLDCVGPGGCSEWCTCVSPCL